MEFVENFYRFKYGNLFFPVTIQKFLDKTANPKKINSSLYQELYLSRNTKLIKMCSYETRLLSLISALTKSNNLIFDLRGLDPSSAIEILKKIKKVTENGGSAIFINDLDDETENSYCDKHISIQIN